MSFLRPDLTMVGKALVIIGLVALFGGFAALLYGEFAPSVGYQGVLDRGIGSAGILAMGLGVLCFVPLVARDPWQAATRSAESPEALLRAAAKELGVVALNLVCYVGAALVALGALTALDRAPIAAGLVMIACIVALVLYRRHRKRHPRSYNLTKPLGIVLFMLAFGFAAGAFGTLQTSSALADALEGPREQVCVLSDFDEQRPTGRYSSLRAADLVIDFTDESGQTVRVAIKEQDRAALGQIAEAGSVVRLAYYPRTNVFVSARPAYGDSPLTPTQRHGLP